MSRFDKEPMNAKDLFDLPGLSLFELDEDLHVLRRLPAGGSGRDGEILAAMTEILASPEAREASRSAGAAPISRIVELGAESESKELFLFTIESRPGKAGDSLTFKALVQNLGGCLPAGVPASPSVGERWSVREFRKFLHELSNPLSVISGFAEYLLSSLPEGTPNRDCVEEIFSNALRMRRLIDEASPTRGGKPKS
jgi:signal transduction histidine kinase